MNLFNSLTLKKEQFIPLTPRKVMIYVCGITPYDTTHLGHAFTYVSFDVLIRYLKFQGFDVVYTQNVTDINDRDNDILQRALDQKTTWQELSQYWTGKFLSDMKLLNWVNPNNYLFASEQIKPMIDLIEKIVKSGVGYVVNGGVYLDISKDPNYGKLSKLSKDEMLVKAQEFEEDLDDKDKRHSLDISLWKPTRADQPVHIPSFDSPWGKGRPGWHVECSAMAISTLGEQIDIHGGGRDLIYPHHESEIAQSQSGTGKIPFAKYWLHTGTVFYNGAKMSKSKGNLVMASSLFEKYSPNVVRYLLLSHHYRDDWEYFESELQAASEKVDKIESVIKKTKNDNKILSKSVEEKFIKIMNDDLDTKAVLELLHSLISSRQISDLKKLYLILGFKI